MDEVVLVADPNGKGFGFAKGVYDYLNKKADGIFSVKIVNVEKTVFKDNEFKVKLSENIRSKKCFFIHDGNKPPCEWFAELAFVLEAMTFSSPAEVNVVLPYLRFARQERKDESRVSVNAKIVADVVSLYADRGMSVDLHAPQLQVYFRVPFDNLYSFPVLISHLKEKHADILDDLVVVSPDIGGGKRAEALVKRLHRAGHKPGIAFGHKTRTKDNQVSGMVVIGDVKGKNCLIIDDMIDTGGTMVTAAEILRKEGAKKVFAYGTHALFTEGTEKFKVFDKVIVSDTLDNKEAGNIEVISLVELFGEAIYRTIVGESLSVLFS